MLRPLHVKTHNLMMNSTDKTHCRVYFMTTLPRKAQQQQHDASPYSTTKVLMSDTSMQYAVEAHT